MQGSFRRPSSFGQVGQRSFSNDPGGLQNAECEPSALLHLGKFASSVTEKLDADERDNMLRRNRSGQKRGREFFAAQQRERHLHVIRLVILHRFSDESDQPSHCEVDCISITRVLNLDS
jgi:hypothetical protein